MDADLTPYRLLHSAGRLAVDACEAARIHGLDHEEQARMLVEVYGMGLVEARQMVLRSGARSEPPSGLSDAEDSSGPLGLGLFQYRLSTLFAVPLLVAFGMTLWKWHWAPVATVVTFFIGCLMTRAARNVSPRSLPTWIASVLLLVTGMALVLWSPWLWVWGVNRPQFPAMELFLFGPIGIPLLLLAGVLGGLLSTAGGSAVVAAAYGVLAAVLLGSSYWALRIEEGLAEFVVFLGSLVTTLLVLSFGWY